MTEKEKEKRQGGAERIAEQPVTYDIYAAMPDDGFRYEIFDGRLELMSPGPSASHQSVSSELEFILKSSCQSEYKMFHAPFDVILSKTNVVQPDIMMIHRSRLHMVTARGIEGAPDLVVEIVSPGSRKRDKVTKRNIYAQHGVPEYWVVDTDSRSLEQYRLDGNGDYALINLFEGDDRVESDKLPCVTFRVYDLFLDMPNA